jgi:competence protein ComGC
MLPPKAQNRFLYGFTLVALLVVISVIAMLMGVLVAVVSRARQSAYRVACMSNLRQIGVAIQIYRDEHRHRFPLARYMPAPSISIMNAKKETLIAALGVLAPVVLVSGIYYAYVTTPPPLPKTFEQAVDTMGSAPNTERL